MDKTTQIQIKVTNEQKEIIKDKAKCLDMTMSDFIKVSVLSDNKNIFLDKGGGIAAALTQIQIELSSALRGKEITSETEVKLLAVMEDVLDKFSKITEQLTEINQDGEVD